MKYCPKCGSSMEDDMLFCQKCGTRIPDIDDSDSVSAHTEESNQTQYEPESYDAGVNSQPSERNGMKKLLIACLLLAGMTVLVGGSKGDFGMVLGMGGFFAVLAVMFFVLAKSPQDNPYILNKASGLKKTTFVVASILMAFVIMWVGTDMGDSMTTKDHANSNSSQSESENTQSQGVGEEETTLSNVIYDMTQYSGMSLDGLKGLFGQPANEENWQNTIIYGFSNGSDYFEFILSDGKCVRATLYAGSYWGISDHVIEYTCPVNDIPLLFNCEGKLTQNTNSAIRVEPDNEKVEDFWIPSMSDSTIDMVKVTYDSSKIPE